MATSRSQPARTIARQIAQRRLHVPDRRCSAPSATGAAVTLANTLTLNGSVTFAGTVGLTLNAPIVLTANRTLTVTNTAGVTLQGGGPPRGKVRHLRRDRVRERRRGRPLPSEPYVKVALHTAHADHDHPCFPRPCRAWVVVSPRGPFAGPLRGRI